MSSRIITLYMEIVGGLDAVARLITMLRKCSTKAEVREMTFRFNGSTVAVEMRVITAEPEWFTNKLSSIYEVQEIAIKEGRETSTESVSDRSATVEATGSYR